jgi:hypothetical protein
VKFVMAAVIGAVIALGSATVFRTFYARKHGQPFMVWPERRVLERQKKEGAHGVLTR